MHKLVANDVVYADWTMKLVVCRQGVALPFLFGRGWDAFGLFKASLVSHAMAWLRRLTE